MIQNLQLQNSLEQITLQSRKKKKEKKNWRSLEDLKNRY